MAQAVDQQNHHVTARKDRISVFQKAVYSIGGLVNNIQAAALGSMVLVLNLGLGMNPALVGIIGAVPRLVDAISDPITGYFSDNIRTRWGRRRPVIFFGALAGGLFFILMFQLFPGKSEMFYFWYFLLFQCLFFLGFTCFSIPWIALGYEMTPDYHERTRLQGLTNFVGQFAWLIAPWFFLFMNNKKLFPDLVSGARSLAFIVGGFLIVGGMLPAIFNKETALDLPQKKVTGAWNVTKDFFKGAGMAFGSRPFLKLCLTTLLIFGGFMLASSFTPYVIFFYVFRDQPTIDLMYQNGGTLLGVNGSISSFFTFIAIFLTTWISTKLGKRKTFLLTMSIAIVGFMIKWFGYMASSGAIATPGLIKNALLWIANGVSLVKFSVLSFTVDWSGFNEWMGSNQRHALLLLATPFIAFHLGSLFTLVSSMVADVCDLDELKNETRREGMFSAIYWWTVKLGIATASLLSGFLLNATGFDQALGLGQPVSALFWMRLCDVGIPIVTTLIAIVIIMRFDISEKRAYDIRQQIERRREDRRREDRRTEERRAEERRQKERRGSA